MSILRHTERKSKMKLQDNNYAEITGFITNDFEYSHRIMGENFYTATLKSERTSGVFDYIQFTVSDRLIEITDLSDMYVRIKGQYRSFNKHNGDGTSKLILSLFVKEIEEIETEEFPYNRITLNGFICKEPIYRTTPLGREIADVLLAVQRKYGKSDYIPCIAWGRNANFVGSLSIGSQIKVSGRIQSRDYKKKLDDGTIVERTCNEVSISSVELVEECED